MSPLVNKPKLFVVNMISNTYWEQIDVMEGAPALYQTEHISSTIIGIPISDEHHAW